MRLDDRAAARLRELNVPPGPLFVCDVDEVVLIFVAALRDYLASQGLSLRTDGFRLHGNVLDSNGGVVPSAQVTQLLDDFFANQERWQRPVEDAHAALQVLEQHGTVVLLTAMRHGHFDARRRLLDRHGIRQPLVTTEGSKGAALASLSHDGPIVFIDDLPANHADVLGQVPGVTAIHLMADTEFRMHLPSLPPDVHAADDWVHAVVIALIAIGNNSTSVASVTTQA